MGFYRYFGTKAKNRANRPEDATSSKATVAYNVICCLLFGVFYCLCFSLRLPFILHVKRYPFEAF